MEYNSLKIFQGPGVQGQGQGRGPEVQGQGEGQGPESQGQFKDKDLTTGP